MFEEMNYKTSWIWLPDWSREDDADARIVYFRKKFVPEDLLPSLPVRITADSRYKLYVNGTFVQEGPAKGDLEQWFVDTADLAPFLRAGENVVLAEVLRYPHQADLRNHSLYRTDWPCLYVDCPGLPSLPGSSGWKCRRASHIRIVGETGFPAPIHIMEEASGCAEFHDFMLPGYDDSLWQEARPYSFMETSPADAPFHLADRDIPPMRHEHRCFEKVVCVREKTPESATGAWEAMLAGSRTDLAEAAGTAAAADGCNPSVLIPARTRQVLEISAGTLQCGYPVLSLSGGKNARLTFVPAESYVYPAPASHTVMEGIPAMPLKGDRTDFVNGMIVGQKDEYTAGGFGTPDHPEIYEPFWFRTFRFVRIEIETQEEPLRIHSLFYRSTGYPFDLKTQIQCSDESFDSIWDISLRTLKRCMHETYMDCPYYEQLQYSMDSRSEILYTYCTAADDRLARRCMEDFRRSQRKDGLISASAPTVKTNVIPGFSIYYILMVHDHMMYFGDKDLVRDHFPAIQGILRFFERNLTEKGLVGHVGGPILREQNWSFIDWTPEWNSTAGVPTACLKGDRSITMESLLYLYGLQTAAELAEYLGYMDISREYLDRAASLKNAIRTCCLGTFSEKPVQPAGSRKQAPVLIQDGPGIGEYSVHCQVFAVITGVFDAAEGRQALEAVIGSPHAAQSSVSFMFYLFRALEKVDWYEKADDLWDLWRQMVGNHLTTCVENTTDGRSDCHAWASVLLYELPSVYLGVRPAAPGYKKISVRPVPGHLTHAEGDVVTPAGVVHVSWKRQGTVLCLSHSFRERHSTEED